MAASLKAALTSLFRRTRDTQQYQMFAFPLFASSANENRGKRRFDMRILDDMCVSDFAALDFEYYLNVSQHFH